MGCKIATNGAIRSPEWWANMAKKFIKLDEMSLELWQTQQETIE